MVSSAMRNMVYFAKSKFCGHLFKTSLYNALGSQGYGMMTYQNILDYSVRNGELAANLLSELPEIIISVSTLSPLKMKTLQLNRYLFRLW